MFAVEGMSRGRSTARTLRTIRDPTHGVLRVGACLNDSPESRHGEPTGGAGSVPIFFCQTHCCHPLVALCPGHALRGDAFLFIMLRVIPSQSGAQLFFSYLLTFISTLVSSVDDFFQRRSASRSESFTRLSIIRPFYIRFAFAH